jgi:glycosyltransferase involved in cell wall biosynthesis
MPTPIVFILDGFSGPLAGTEGQFLLILRNLDRRRFTPRVVLLRGPDQLSAHIPGVFVEILGVSRIASLSAWIRACRLAFRLRREGVRLAHLFFNDVCILLPIPFVVCGLRVLAARQDLGFWYTPRILRALRITGRFTQAIVANARAVAQVVMAQERVRPDRVCVIYNGVTRELSSQPRDAVRAAFSIDAAAPLIVSVANLRPLKRMEDAIRALASLPSDLAAVQLAIVGADRPGSSGKSHRQELQALAVQLGLTDRVHLLGAIDDPMPLLQSANIAVLCSDTEGLPSSVVEYMLAGVPVVCTRVGGNEEIVTDGDNGFLYEPRDVGALVRHLVRLLRDTALAENMGARGRAIVESRLSPRQLVAHHQALYDRLLRAKPAAESRESTGDSD